MKYITKRAMFYTFATQGIEEGEAIAIWRAVAELFGIPKEEQASGEALLSSATFADLKTALEVRLVQKCAGGFGGAFELTEDEQEALGLKYHALTKVGQLAAEYHMSPRKAVASAYRRDSAAPVLYALQILLHNEGRSELGEKILFEALTADQNGDAGLLLLHARRDDKVAIFARLAETPEMILHPEVLEELSKQYGVKLQASDRGTRIGF